MTGEMSVVVEGVGFGLGIVKVGMGRGVGGVWDCWVHECYAVPPSPPADFTCYDLQCRWKDGALRFLFCGIMVLPRNSALTDFIPI